MSKLTLDMYLMGRDKAFPLDYTPTIKLNAEALLRAVTALLEDITPNVVYSVSSGWRPRSVNASIASAAKRSNHMIGCAIDILDDGAQTLGHSITNELLIKYGLYMEALESTKGIHTNWVHLQTISPRSGNRIFKP